MMKRDNSCMKAAGVKPPRGGGMRRHLALQAVAMLGLALGAAVAARAEDESVSGTASAASSVDMRIGDLTIIGGSVAVGYSPSWSGVTNADAYIQIEKVIHADMFNVTTSTVATLSAGDSGTFLFTPSAGDEPCARLLHRAYSAGGQQIGKTLVRDVAFGCEASANAAADVDCRAVSFQEAVSTWRPVGLLYSTAWATNATSIAISAVQTMDGRGASLAVPLTNSVFSAQADAEGTHQWNPRSGGWRLLLTSFDAFGNALGEPYFAEYFLRARGTTVYLR